MFCGLHFPPSVRCTYGGACEHAFLLAHTNALVAYNGGTSVGHGLVRTLFLEPDFVPSAGTPDVGQGPVRIVFLGVILCLVPMAPCETMFYWPHTSALVAYNGGTSVGHSRVRTLFLDVILCLVPMTPCEAMLYWLSPN